jgi:hypothetical protein
VVPSALRTLSVVTLLSAVSGTVFLLDGGSEHPASADAASASLTAGPKDSAVQASQAQIALADLMARRVPSQRTEEDNLRAGEVALATERREAARKAAAEAKRKAELKARKAREEAEKKAAAAAARRKGAAHAAASRSFSGDPKSIARELLGSHGWSSSQFGCLDSLWQRESGWNYRAYNASSGAYGIPQALPGSKMGTVASDWRTNPATQIRWGLNYIADRYGSPCGAWSHSESTGWY